MTTRSGTFEERLRAVRTAHDSLVCVGIDPDPRRLPAGFAADPDGVFAWAREIVDATLDLACAVKPNLAFFEAIWPDGLRALDRLVRHIDGRVPVIGDAKRGDVPSTAEAYATALFDRAGFDALTVNPLLGRDSVEPFLRRRDRGVFLLARTSNPGARDVQDRRVDDRPLYLHLAALAQEWNGDGGNCGLVVGATYPDELAEVRALAPRLPILVPGVGAQGGEVAATVRAGAAATTSIVVNSSRGITYASSGRDFATAARAAADRLRREINAALAANLGAA